MAKPGMAASRAFPLLVEGSWGRDPPKNLSTKLQSYFQSRKRSGGGGECEVRRDPESPGRFLVLFSEDGEGRTARASGAGWGGHPLLPRGIGVLAAGAGPPRPAVASEELEVRQSWSAPAPTRPVLCALRPCAVRWAGELWPKQPMDR